MDIGKFTPIPYTTDDFHSMPYRILGRSGLRASLVGLGTWKFGYPELGDEARVDQKTAFAILDRAVELGVTFWDTANRYNNGSGNSERIIGEWFKMNPDQRTNVVLATKLFGGTDGLTPNHSRLSRMNILNSLYASLKRLQLEYVDVIYFHTLGDMSFPLDESMAAIEDLVRRDMVRYLAVSNVSVDQLKYLQEFERTYTVRCRVIAVQNRYDILNHEAPDLPGVLEYCARSGVSFIAYSPLARGLLSERYLESVKIKAGDRLYDEGTLQQDLNETVVIKLNQFAKLAHEWGYEVNQLALAYMLTLPGMGPVIPSSSSVKQLESNARAGTIQLDHNQITKIQSILN